MFLDEKKREGLLKIYEGLPENARRICRMMAIAAVPVTARELSKCLNDVEVPAPKGGEWTRAQAAKFLEHGLPAEMREAVVENGHEHHRLLTPLIDPLWREAEQRGEFQTFEAAADKMMRLRSQSASRSAPAAPFFSFQSIHDTCRALRKALYKGDKNLLQIFISRAFLFGKYDERGDSMVHEILQDFTTPSRLPSLAPPIAAILFPILLNQTVSNIEDYAAAADALFSYPRREDNPPELELFRCERLILHGRADEAERRLASIRDPQAYNLRAFLALALRGDELEALDLYVKGTKPPRGRRRTGGQTSYCSWAGLFYPVLLFKSGTDEDRKDINSQLRLLSSCSLPGAPLLAALLRGILQPGENYRSYNKAIDSQGGSVPIDMVSFAFFLILRYWQNIDDDQELLDMAFELAGNLEERGLTFLAGEMRAIRDEKPETNPCPLCGLLRHEERWARSLSELSSIGGGAAKGRSRRVAWKLSWHARDGKVRRLSITPVEQTLQRNGWSKGRNIALRRLQQDNGSIEGITDQDLRVIPAIREYQNYYGATEYSLDAAQALSALAGHPYLFQDETGDRVEVSASEPLLSVREHEKGYVLSISPFPTEGDALEILEEGPDSLRVTHFDVRHLRVAEILGPSGLLIPAHARDALAGTLDSLASVVTIHSDLQSDLEGRGVELAEADERLCVQIQPAGAGLDVEVVVRPLGPGSAPCYPGRGGANLFGTRDGKRFRTVRDLEAEAGALAEFQRLCPVLAEADQVRDEAWRLPDTGIALEFLSQLGELGDSVVVEWPRGQSMKLVAPPEGGGFTVSVRKAQDWFALSGALRVREDLVLDMRTLLEAMREGHGRFVPLGNGEFLALTREFQRRLEGLLSLGDVRGEEVRIAPLAAGLAADLLEGTGRVEATAEWQSRLALVAEAEALMPALPSTFRGELRSYQLDGFQWLMRLAHWGAGACLADDMGLGKTIQTLAMLVARGPLGPSLIVAPTSVCPNWVNEAARFAPTLNMKELRQGDRSGRAAVLSGLGPMDAVVASYGLLQNEMEGLMGVSWNVIVLDEAQAIKNMGTKRSSAVMKLEGAFRVATTGTPIENQLTELWNIFRFLNPGYLGSLESFRRRFAEPIERNDDKGARQRLRQMIQPFILRRSKTQVLSELPPKTEITLTVDLKDGERAFYEALRRSALEELSGVQAGEGERFQVFAALMRLRRACCSTSLVEAGVRLPSAKLEAFADILAELRQGGHKALVFSQFVDHLSLLREWLDGQGIRYQYLDGSTPSEERQRRVAAFQAGEGDCFLISLKAGGTGLNLTAADYVVHMDPWWNPAVEEQASDRAHRIGQERPVTVYRIVARGTIEERIVALHDWKRGLADGLLDESGTASRLSVAELLELIRGQ